MDKTKQRIYIDTSVIGGCEDYEFSKWSIQLFEEFRQGLKTAVISNLTRRELERAPESVKKNLLSLPDTDVENVSLTEEAESLAQNYIDDRVVGARHIADAQHIAIASVERVDVLVSWNFQHIVNLDRIHAFNSVNLKLGYLMLEIRSPREVIHEKEI
ncbi:MAG: PIN domain protein [Candidatus Methanogaster sp.]|uniref:PIN domain protein n=1 Tax=Candidatus Methanogaster sp. TaxID=3386292 RepID=A0AC61L368_9EURY|nr:MAG: PIN domain protein [ANME-2 cluster archaeon]